MSKKFTIAETARILQVDKDTIKTWAYHFSKYLNPNANPPKGYSREFVKNDFRIFAYLLLYWEKEPDIEAIKTGLNRNAHFEIDLIDNLISQITPFFSPLPENIEEKCYNGIVLNGLSPIGDIFTLANSYQLAGDRLVEIALENEEAQDLYCPAIYTYRHAIELYLKSVLNGFKQSHNLLALLEKLKDLFKQLNAEMPKWFEDLIISFNDFDPYGTTFRYGGNQEKDEVFVDLRHLKLLMNWVAEAFKNIKNSLS